MVGLPVTPERKYSVDLHILNMIIKRRPVGCDPLSSTLLGGGVHRSPFEELQNPSTVGLGGISFLRDPLAGSGFRVQFPGR